LPFLRLFPLPLHFGDLSGPDNVTIGALLRGQPTEAFAHMYLGHLFILDDVDPDTSAIENYEALINTDAGGGIL